MAKILIHVTCGPESPTKAALGFLVAKAAVDEGHEVSMFLAGDGVQLLRDAVLDTLAGLGTGSLRESYDAVVASGARLYASGCRARLAASPSRTSRESRSSSRCRAASCSSRSRTTAF